MTAEHKAVEVSLPTDTEILISRWFRTPTEVIYRAWITPDLVRRWWGGQRGTVSVDMDFRVGGRWRYVLLTDDGAQFAFHGVYREIVPGERIVYTEVFEDEPDAEAQTTVTFGADDGGTRLAVLVRYGSRAERDAHRHYMASGLAEALDLLEHIARSPIPILPSAEQPESDVAEVGRS
jgi:uncharacterized protein YndB with AHSA1/START domain